MVKLKLNGKSLELHSLPPSIIQIKTFLDKAPEDELFTTPELAVRLGLSYVHVRILYRNSALIPYSYSCGNREKRFWGNPRAISELMRQIKNESK